MDQPRRRTAIRIAAWACLTLVLTAGAATQVAASPDTSALPGPPATAAARQAPVLQPSDGPGPRPVVQPAGTAARQSPAASTLATSAPEAIAAGGREDVLLLAAPEDAIAGTAFSAWPGAASVDTLPAWRWQNIALDSDSSWITDPMRSGTSTLGVMLLMAANFCWQVLLWVLRFAIAGSSELLTFAAGPINSAVGSLSGVAWAWLSLPIVAWLLWKVVSAWTGKGNVAKATRTALRGLLALGLLVTIGMASAEAAKTWNAADIDGVPNAIAECDKQVAGEPDPGAAADLRKQCVDEKLAASGDLYDRMRQQRDASGTLPWFAYTISSAAAGMASVLNVADLIPLPGSVNQATGSVSPNCAAYISQMHKGFTEANGDGSSATLSTLSRLWENTQYRSWMGSAFGQASGGYDLPANSMCRFAETVNNRSPFEQQTIESLAETGFNGSTPIALPQQGATLPVFGPFADYSVRDARLSTAAWVACKWDGSAWTVSDAFAKTNESADIASDCQGAFTGDTLPSLGAASQAAGAGSALVGGIVGGQGVDALGNVLASTDVPLASMYSQPGAVILGSDGSAQQSDNQAAVTWISAYRGLNSGERLLNGLLALATAIVFMLTLGQIGLGLFLAQFMLILLLLLFPVILVMWAVGLSDKARGLARLTLTLLFAQVFFTLLISAIIASSVLFQRLATAVAGPLLSNGLVRTLLFGLSPIIAFYLIRKLISMLGLANVMSFSGALGFVAGSAMLATGDQKTAQAARTTSWRGGKSPLQQTLEKGKMGKLEKLGGSALTSPMHPRNATKGGRARTKDEWQKAGLVDPAKRAERKRYRKQDTAYRDAVDRLSAAGKLSKTKGKRVKGLLDTAVAAGDVFYASAGAAVASTKAFGGKLRGKGKRRAGDGYDPRKDGPIPNTEQPLGEGPEVRTPSYVTPAEARHAEVVARQRLNGRVRSGQITQAAAQREHVQRSMQAASGIWLDHVGSDFRGFTSPVELASYRAAVAQHSGLNSSDIAVGYSGMSAVKWRDRSEMRSLTPQALRDPGLWLSMEYGAQRAGETSDDYLARRYATLLESGMMSPSGDLVDGLELIGLGPDTPQREVRVQSWLDGRSDPILDSAVLNLKNTNSAAVIRASQIASQWASQRLDAVAQQRERAVQDLAEAVHAARRSAPEISAQVSQLHQAFQERAAQHEQRLRAWREESSEQARQAVLESFQAMEQALDAVRGQVADGEMTRQTISLGSAGIGADVEDLLEQAGRAMESRIQQLEDIDAKASAALFDQDDTGLRHLLASVDSLTRGFEQDLQRSAQDAEAALQRAVQKMEISEAETQVRLDGTSKRFEYARSLVEQAGMPAFP